MEKKGIRNYRDLIVRQKAHELVKEVLNVCRKFPRSDEAGIIKKQLIRSSTSIPANIAEGFAGNKGRVFQNSLTIAGREASETDYWLFLSFEGGFLDKTSYQNLERGYLEVRSMLSSMILKLIK